ncbi:mannose-1-phosphate guanylyltransferase [Sediminibacterium goheungense]|uniref:mannose-1-phosphate guanylyltransferase n=1 Tax=Sediminibacterium goheungense TaxID=1086393 RepID=A0A4R6ISQ7_9BACT|nr:mannose-1-phosphate guanylyltransferase [Sediminibacterium goheungense]TDO25337.1 mannose-1-phosphate guanylyltransferase [Sediminibacterium goheungense]
MNANNYAVIMAGGIGSRFWPMSRTAYPKQFLDILNTGHTLLQSTFNRFAKIIPVENIFIVTANDYTDIVNQQLPQLPVSNIIGEPERKNTAPCIALIALKIKKLNPQANLIVSPSDHLIENETVFIHHCLTALAESAAGDKLITFGIQPSHANTGYGYIQYEANQPNTSAYKVKRFTEKPDKKTAIQFLQNGSYLWNSGIFFWKADTIINAFRMYMPNMFDVFVCGQLDLNTEKEAAAIEHIYQHCPSISIDYGILEKAENVYVMPVAFGWNDLGTWNSAWENAEKDHSLNAIKGHNTMAIDSRGCIVHSTDKKLVLVGGVSDLIIVNTPDALLICNKDNEQQIKEYLTIVKETKGELYL